jgi:hypothetical protein
VLLFGTEKADDEEGKEAHSKAGESCMITLVGKPTNHNTTNDCSPQSLESEFPAIRVLRQAN